MAYIKLNLNGQAIELTPAVLKDINEQVQAQWKSLTLLELMAMQDVMHLKLGQIMGLIRGEK